MIIPYDIRLYILPEYRTLDELVESPMFVREFIKRITTKEALEYVVNHNDRNALNYLYLHLDLESRLFLLHEIIRKDNSPMLIELLRLNPGLFFSVKKDLLPYDMSNGRKDKNRKLVTLAPDVFVPLFIREISIGSFLHGTPQDRFEQDLCMLSNIGSHKSSVNNDEIRAKIKQRYGPMLNFVLGKAFNSFGYKHVPVSNIFFQEVHAILLRVLKTRPEILINQPQTNLCQEYIYVIHRDEYQKFVTYMVQDSNIIKLLQQMAVALL